MSRLRKVLVSDYSHGFHGLSIENNRIKDLIRVIRGSNKLFGVLSIMSLIRNVLVDYFSFSSLMMTLKKRG